MAARSRRRSTRDIYSSRLRHFASWCSGRDLDPTQAPLISVADFFMHLFRSGLQVTTIRNYRSAIAAIHQGFADGSSISSNDAIQHLFRGMFTQRPPVKRLIPSWDLSAVLRLLAGPPFEPLSGASLLHVSIKLAFLLAVATSRRGSELKALSIDDGHMRWEPHGVRLVPALGFLTKNQSASFHPPEIFVPDITKHSGSADDKPWCPVRTLKWYLARTKQLRGATSQLFITTVRPHHAASRDTIARWIVSAIKFANVNWPSPPDNQTLRSITAHDVRAVSASWAFFRGVPMEDICKAACWKTPSTFTSCYLSDVLQRDSAHGRSVLAPPSAESRSPTMH